jgi:hypothetical protein
MPPVGFEPTISGTERVKIVHDSDRAATVMPAALYSPETCFFLLLVFIYVRSCVIPRAYVYISSRISFITFLLSIFVSLSSLPSSYVLYNFVTTVRRNSFPLLTKKGKTLRPKSASKLYRPSDRRLWVTLVPIFAVRGSHVVSMTDPYGRILYFLDRSRYFLLPSSSSVVLTRLSGPHFRPTTS